MFSELIRSVQCDMNIAPEEVANKILDFVDYKETDKAVPIVDIAKNMGFFVKTANGLPNNDSGFIIISPELKEDFKLNKGIILSEKIKYGKSRFVIAHEIGHYLFDFNEQLQPEFSHTFTEHYNRDSQDDPNEKRVNEFAACLLMPKEMFKNQFNQFKSNQNLSLADIISNLSDLFEVTPKAVEARITELGLA